MPNNDINNPPFPPKGKVAEWNGTEWVLVNEPSPIPPMPTTPGQWAWNGTEWVDMTPAPPPAPTPREITTKTIWEATYCLQLISGLATQELQEHISLGSSQAVSQYIHDMGNIVAAAQNAYINNEAYDPVFPVAPTLIPSVGGVTPPVPPVNGVSTASTFATAVEAPYIQFITEK